MSSADLFIVNFNNLDGVSLAERRRNFYKLLDTNKDLKSNPVIVDEIVGKLKPRTFLEELFRLDLLLYYQCTQELYNIFKDGNDIFVSKIVKHQWFFKEIFKDIDPEQLIHDILPTTSYTIRMKILKKLSSLLHGERFDRIYDGLNQRYGQFIANQFLLGCSDKKIEKILQDHKQIRLNNNQIRLNNNQIMILYKRDPQLILKYFKIHRPNSYNYLKFFNHIFVNDYEFYRKLDDEYSLSTHLGKRSTRRIVYNRRDHMIQSPDYYRNRVNLTTTIRKLRGDSKILLKNAVEERCQSSNKIREIFDWIQIFPKKYQWKLFKEYIMNRYKIEEYLKLVDQRFIEIIDNADDRQLIVKRKILDGDENFIKFLDINESIPMLKEKINLTSKISDRKHLLRQLIETCHFHNDINALTNVVKYFSSKHRNDDEYLQLDFLRAIKQTYGGYRKLNEEIWKSLHEIFEMHKLKFNVQPSMEDRLCYIEFLFDHNQSNDDELLKILKSGEINSSEMKYNRKFWKYILEFVINNAPRIVKEKNLLQFDIEIIDQINRWNQENPNDQLSIFDNQRIMNNFKLFLSDKSYSYTMYVILNRMVKNKSAILRDECLQYFWRDILNYGNLKNLSWLLKYDIIEIQNNVNEFANWCINHANDNRFLYILKKYTHLQFDNRLIELSLKNLDKDNSIRCLSVLMPGERFQQFADEYSQIPSKKLNLKDDKEMELYRIRCCIANFYKNTKYPKAINSLLKYCIGDYLGSAITSMYSFMYHLPENQLGSILDEINTTKAVSFRKHALFLACELTDYNTVKRIITIINQTEGVQSLQKRLIKTTLQYLKKNPTEQIFELYKFSIRFVNKNDDDLLEELVDIYDLPRQFITKYGEFIWNFLDFIKDRPARYQQLKETTLRRLCYENVDELSLEFCQTIIDEHFLKMSIITQPIIFDFIRKLFVCKNKQLLIFQQIIRILDELQNDDNKQTFISSYSNTFMEIDSIEFLQFIVIYWEKLIDPIQHFSSYVNIFFLKLKICQISTIDTIIEKIVEFFNDLIEKYSQFIVYNFDKLMYANIRYFIDDRYDYYEKLLLKYYNNINVVMLVLLWLPENCPQDKSEQYQRIFKKIEMVEFPGVRINFKLKFKNVDCNEDDTTLMETD